MSQFYYQKASKTEIYYDISSILYKTMLWNGDVNEFIHSLLYTLSM
jgi:hypothetical protein